MKFKGGIMKKVFIVEPDQRLIEIHRNLQNQLRLLDAQRIVFWHAVARKYNLSLSNNLVVDTDTWQIFKVEKDESGNEISICVVWKLSAELIDQFQELQQTSKKCLELLRQIVESESAVAGYCERKCTECPWNTKCLVSGFQEAPSEELIN